MEPTYTPKVGARYDSRALEGRTREQILQRPLVDPAFSDQTLGSTTYNWRSDYTLDIADNAMRERVEKFMDALASVPEGRHHLRQAAAMQKHRLEARDSERDIAENEASLEDHRAAYEKASPEERLHMKPPLTPQENAVYIAGLPRPDPNGKITIRDDPSSRGPAFDRSTGTISFNSRNSPGFYLGLDGKYHVPTWETILHHEIGHAKDPLNTYDNRSVTRSLSGSTSDSHVSGAPASRTSRGIVAYSISRSDAIESPVIHDTNNFINLYPEHSGLKLTAPRSLDHSATRRTFNPEDSSIGDLGDLPDPLRTIPKNAQPHSRLLPK